MMTKQNIKKYAILPKFLKHNSCENLIRLGNNDGGYLVCKNDVIDSQYLLSFGINTNWDFEYQFKKVNDLKITAYDASTNLNLFIRQMLGSLLRGQIKNIYIVFRGLIHYKIFFRNDVRHIKKFVGDIDNSNYIKIGNILKDINNKKIFLKMDIEGNEYRCLDSIINFQCNIIGAVIEFHSFDLHIDKIENFISKFYLKICHIHVNNNDDLLLNKTPVTLEISFTRNKNLTEKIAIYPNILDKPNNINNQEYLIKFKND